MDRWQLCHLTLSLVLPLRPEEAAGLLVSEVRFDKSRLEIGTRLAGDDFTKGRTSFVLPFPKELHPLLRHCIAGRTEGPLLRKRTVWVVTDVTSVVYPETSWPGSASPCCQPWGWAKG